MILSSKGDHVFLKVSPTKGVMRFKKKSKLDSEFIGPFETLKIVGDLTYELALPLKLLHVHRVFDVSMLRKYIHDPSHILEYEPLQVCENLSYEEELVMFLDQK